MPDYRQNYSFVVVDAGNTTVVMHNVCCYLRTKNRHVFRQTLPPAHEYILYTNLPNLATFAMRKETTNGSVWLQSDTAIDLLLPPHPRLAGEASRLFAVIFVTADFNTRHCEKRLLFCRDVAIPRKGSALFQSGTATNLLLPPHPRLAGEASRLFAVIFVTADFNTRHCEKRLLFCRDVAIPRKGSALFQSGTARYLLLPPHPSATPTPSPRGRRLCKVKTIRLSRRHYPEQMQPAANILTSTETTIYSDGVDWCREPQLANECDRNVLSVRDLARLST